MSHFIHGEINTFSHFRGMSMCYESEIDRRFKNWWDLSGIKWLIFWIFVGTIIPFCMSITFHPEGNFRITFSSKMRSFIRNVLCFETAVLNKLEILFIFPLRIHSALLISIVSSAFFHQDSSTDRERIKIYKFLYFLCLKCQGRYWMTVAGINWFV